MMADIAKNCEMKPVPLRDVAERQGLSKLYLSQLAMPLRNAALLRSVWGNRGGYQLSRPSAEIKLLEIIEAVDGPVAVIDCVANPETCDRSDYCECIGVWNDINKALTGILKRYSLADLIARGEPKGQAGLSCFPQLKDQGVVPYDPSAH